MSAIGPCTCGLGPTVELVHGELCPWHYVSRTHNNPKLSWDTLVTPDPALRFIDQPSAMDQLISLPPKLNDPELALLRRYINSEYEARLARLDGFTPEERACGSKIDRIKSVRARTGLGLADAKELVERWEREGR